MKGALGSGGDKVVGAADTLPYGHRAVGDTGDGIDAVFVHLLVTFTEAGGQGDDGDAFGLGAAGDAYGGLVEDGRGVNAAFAGDDKAGAFQLPVEV